MTLALDGLGPDSETTTNAQGGRQSAIPYRADLLPPRALLEVAAVLHGGAEKYEDDIEATFAWDYTANWRSIQAREHVNHAMAHLLGHLAGDRQEGPIGHLAHAATRLLFALELEAAT